MSSATKRSRKQVVQSFPGLPGQEDYFVFYYVKTRTYSEPIYIASSMINMPMEDRITLQEKDCVTLKSGGEKIPAMVVSRGTLLQMTSLSERLEKAIDEGVITDHLIDVVKEGEFRSEEQQHHIEHGEFIGTIPAVAKTAMCSYRSETEEGPSIPQSPSPCKAMTPSNLYDTIRPNVTPKKSGLMRELVDTNKSILVELKQLVELNTKMLSLMKDDRSSPKIKHKLYIIKSYEDLEVDLTKVYASDERQMAWKILNFLTGDVRGKIIEPQKKCHENRIISHTIITELKHHLGELYESFDWDVVRRSLNQRIRDMEKKKD